MLLKDIKNVWNNKEINIIPELSVVKILVTANKFINLV